MASNGEPDQVRSLKEAVRLSPDNVPLRQALGDALLASGLAAEAATEFKAALADRVRQFMVGKINKRV